MRSKQSGATLIITLIMLLIMTMLGVTTIKTTVIGERMTGHFFNKRLSFDAAEAALRVGENAADAFPITAPTDGTDGLYVPNPTGTPIWLDPLIPIPDPIAVTIGWQDRAGILNPLDPLADQPQYIAEYLGGVPRDQNCALDADASTNQDCWRHAYRVSARGWGKNLNAQSLTQSTFLSRK